MVLPTRMLVLPMATCAQHPAAERLSELAADASSSGGAAGRAGCSLHSHSRQTCPWTAPRSLRPRRWPRRCPCGTGTGTAAPRAVSHGTASSQSRKAGAGTLAGHNTAQRWRHASPDGAVRCLPCQACRARPSRPARAELVVHLKVLGAGGVVRLADGHQPRQPQVLALLVDVGGQGDRLCRLHAVLGLLPARVHLYAQGMSPQRGTAMNETGSQRTRFLYSPGLQRSSMLHLCQTAGPGKPSLPLTEQLCSKQGW